MFIVVALYVIVQKYTNMRVERYKCVFMYLYVYIVKSIIMFYTNLYIKVKKNPLNSLQKRVYQLLSYLNDNDYLPKKYHKFVLHKLTQCYRELMDCPRFIKTACRYDLSFGLSTAAFIYWLKF